MPQDYNDYFLSRISAPIAEPIAPVANVESKFESLQRASQDKISQLQARRAELLASEKAAAESASGQLGLNPDGFAGQSVNLGASAFSGATRRMGNALTAGVGAVAGINQSRLSEDDIAALGRHSQAQANGQESSPDDLAQISRKIGTHVSALPADSGAATPYQRSLQEQTHAQATARAQAKADLNPDSPTPLSIWNQMNQGREVMTSIRSGADYNSLVHQGNREQFSQDLNAGYDPASTQLGDGLEALAEGKVGAGLKDVAVGYAKLLFNAGDAVRKNPAAAMEYMAENAPQLLIGAAGKVGMGLMTASNIGYGFDTYNKEIETYQAEHGGALPPEAERQRMAVLSASLVVAEQGSDLIGLGVTKLGAKAGKATARTSFLAAMKGTGKAAGEGVLSEMPTEGYQTWAEGEIAGKPATGADIYSAGVIGGVSGGGISGGGRAVSEAATLAAQPAATKPATPEELSQNALVEASVASGDVAPLTDPTKPTYAPEKAIRALYGNSQLETSTEEAKQGNLAKADAILVDLDAERKAVQSELVTPAEKQAAIDSLKERQAALDPADTAQVARFAAVIKAREEALAEPALDAAALAGIKARSDKLNRLYTSATEARDNLANLVQPAKAVESLLAEANLVVDPEQDNSPAVEKVLTLAMASSGRLDPAQATLLADNAGNALTAPQRDYLRAFSEARIAENALVDMGGVSADIYLGRKNKGITQYRAAFGRALAAGNLVSAGAELAGLEKFEQDHVAKAKAVTGALAQGVGTQVIRTKDGSWAIGDQSLTKTQLTQNGGLAVNSARLVQSIQAEASSLTKAVTEMRLARQLKAPTKVSQPATQEASDVTNRTQPGTVTNTAGNSEAAGVPDPKGPGKSGGEVDQGNIPAGRSPDAAVEADGLTAVVSDSSVKTEKAQKTESTVSSKTAEKTETVELKSTQSNAVELKSTENIPDRVEPKAGDLAETLEQQAQVVEAVESATAPVFGALVALAAKSPEGTEYKKRKLLGDYIRQSAGTEDGTQRPLVVVKDFLSQLSMNLALQYTKATEFSQKQREALKMFKDTAVSWQPVIKANLVKKEDEDYYHRDLMQFLIQGSGKDADLEENVKTAIAYAAFHWVVGSAARPRFNGPKEINALLDREENHDVTEAEQLALGSVGGRLNAVANEMGSTVTQALGMKASKDAKGNILPQLQAAMGGHVLKLLMDLEIVTRDSVDGETMASFTGSENTDTNAAHHFIKLSAAEDGALHPTVVDILASARGSQGVLDKMFSVESNAKAPTFEPAPYTQSKTKNTNQDVPSVAKSILEKENAVASYVQPGMWQFASIVSEEILMEIAGAEHIEGKHAANVSGVVASNDALQREITNLKDFVGDMMTDGVPDTTKPMFFEHTMWMPQRVGISTNLINPQTSKVHRHMLYRQAWDTEIDTTNDEQMENFLIRVGEGLGVKADKQGNDKSLDDSKAKIASANDAVAVLAAMLQNPDNGTMSDADQATVLKAVQAGGENMHSMASLMALAQYRVADTTGQTTFRTQLMGEVDGVTNGPMLSHLLFGAANTVEEMFSLLNRGGFFEEREENQYENYNLWRAAAGNFDLYETTAGHMTEAVTQFINEGISSTKGKVLMSGNEVNRVMASVYAFTGELVDKNGTVQKAGRNIIKTPLTAMVFGSSVDTAVKGMANKFVSSIYAAMEDTAAGKSGSMSREELVKNLNTLLTQGNAPRMPENISMSELMSKPLSKAQIEGLQKAFENTLGKAVRVTMEQDFAVFIERRKDFNKAAQLTHGIYEAAFTAMHEQVLNEQMDLNEKDPAAGIPFRMVKDAESGSKVREALHDLSAEEVAVIRKTLSALTPVMHSPMSKDSGQLSAGLYIGKRKKKLSTRDNYKSELKFGTGIKGEKVWSKTKKAYVEQTGFSVTGYEMVGDSPGVAMLPVSTHSSDSATMHYSMGDSEALNVHDAKGVGVGGFQAAAQSLNQSLAGVMLNYSPASEVYDALSRTVNGFSALVKEGKMPAEAITKLDDLLAAMAAKDKMGPEYGSNMLELLVIGTKNMAFNADSMKLETLSKLASLDQYALQGGQHQVSETDRAAAAAKRAELSREVEAKTTESLIQIENALKELGTKKLIDTAPVVEEDQTPAPTPDSSFGKLGEPMVRSDPDLLAFFKKNPTPTVDQVLDVLAQKLSDKSLPNREFNVQLVKMLKKAVNPKLVIQMITGQTKYESIMKAPGQARGWYTFTGDRDAVYFLGPEFADSGVTVELLLHELTHAAVAQKMHDGSAEAQPYIDDLQALLEKAQAFVKTNKMSEWGPAVSNLDELVAWGMTSELFQQRVLAKIPFTSNAKSATGLQAFIQKITGLLFGGWAKRPEIANGMEALVSNATNLFAQATGTRANTDKTGTMSMATQQQAAIDNYSTMDIFNAIDNGSLNSGFQGQLRGLLGGMVEKLHGPFGSFKAAMRKDQAGNPLSVWLKALDTGVAPFASSILASGFTGNNQQDFVIEQVEATVRAALSNKEAQSKETYRELAALYTETYDRLKPADFLGGKFGTTTAAEAQALYDFIFKLEKSNGDRSDYLARFAALGLAHEGFNDLLKVATHRAGKPKAKSFAERLQNVFEDILAFFQRKITHTFDGQRGDDKLNTLVGLLVDIEAKKRHALQRTAAGNVSFMGPIEEKAKEVADAGMAKVLDLLNSPKIRANKNVFVKASGALARTVAGGRVDQLMEAMSDLRDKQFKGQLGIVAGLMNNVKGPNEKFKFLLLATKLHERIRKAIITQRKKFALRSFINGGRDLEDLDKKAITNVFMRTGAHNLLDTMSLAEIEAVLGDKSALDLAIQKYEDQLDQFGASKRGFSEAAEGLGYYKATEINRIEFLRMNAYAIANEFGGLQKNLSAAQVEAAIKVISPLITLYALRHTDAKTMSLAKEVMRAENARPAADGNGVEFILLGHKHLEAEALAKLFNGNPALMVHGYTPEIYNPHTQLTTANAADGKELENLGYSKGVQVPLDPADPDQEVKFLYSLKDGGMASHITGVIGIGSKSAKGTKIHDGYMNTNNPNGSLNAAAHSAVARHRQLAMANASAGPRRDLSKETRSFMAPVFNESGNAVNWRYLMAASTKDVLLQRNNDFSTVCGTLAGSIQGKLSTVEQNRVAVTTMLDQFKSEYATKGSSYVLVGPKSTDPELRAIWALLPDETKQDVQDIWDTDGMMVRSDSLDVMFGYRKVSAADPIDRLNAERKQRKDLGLSTARKDLVSANAPQKLVIDFMELMLSYSQRVKGVPQQDADDYAKRLSLYVSKGERGWQELVSATKDVIVVKTGVTMIGNIFSNFSMLYLQGVSVSDMVKHTLVALKGATTHRADTAELEDLRTQLATGFTQGRDSEIRRRISILEDAITRNPVNELIEAGLMPTIVEDLDQDEDIYSYGSALSKQVSKVTDKLNPTVVSVARTVLMTHDTKLYKGLSHITQLSDFVARYALYQHQTTRKKNPLSHKDAVMRASDAFVNYDIPMHRGMQYSDDMGFTMFTKYFLYIQRELLRVTKENPARVYSMLMLSNFMDLGPIVLEGYALSHFGNNPLRSGPLEFSLDKLMTVSSALAIVK